MDESEEIIDDELPTEEAGEFDIEEDEENKW